jgi:hypothetical protein
VDRERSRAIGDRVIHPATGCPADRGTNTRARDRITLLVEDPPRDSGSGRWPEIELIGFRTK